MYYAKDDHLHLIKKVLLKDSNSWIHYKYLGQSEQKVNKKYPNNKHVRVWRAGEWAEEKWIRNSETIKNRKYKTKETKLRIQR